MNPQTGAFLEVSAGGDLVCGLRVNGTVTCWGAGIPGPPSDTFTHISAGFTHACGVRTDQTLACWGVDVNGDLNAPSGTFLDVSAGYDNSCAVRTGGNAVCWGGNSQGKNQVIQLGDFAHTSTGFDHTCSLRANSLVSCWGSNQYFQSIAPSSSLVVSAGGMHNCAILTTAQVQCWGSNAYGQATVPTGLFLPVHHGDMHIQLSLPIAALQVDPAAPAALQVGDTITIDPGNEHEETATVAATPASAGTLASGDVVYLEAPLQFDHDAGAVIVRIDDTPPPAIGDLDCDSAVGVPDGLRLLRFLAGASLEDIRSCPPPGSLTPTGAGISVGDFDCDGSLNAIDALKLFTYAAGLQVQHACAIP